MAPAAACLRRGVSYWALARCCECGPGSSRPSAPGRAMASWPRPSTHLADSEERRWILPRLAHLLAWRSWPPSNATTCLGCRRFFRAPQQRGVTVLVFEGPPVGRQLVLDSSTTCSTGPAPIPCSSWSWPAPSCTTAIPAGPPAAGGHRDPPGAAAGPADGGAAGRAWSRPARRGCGRQSCTGPRGSPVRGETVRMAAGPGLLERHGDRYQLAGPVQDLEVPETPPRPDRRPPRRLGPPNAAASRTRRSRQDLHQRGRAASRQQPRAVWSRCSAAWSARSCCPSADPRSPELGHSTGSSRTCPAVRHTRPWPGGTPLTRTSPPPAHRRPPGGQETRSSRWWRPLPGGVAVRPDTPDAAGIKAKAIELLRGGRRAASLAAAPRPGATSSRRPRWPTTRWPGPSLLEHAARWP